MRFLSLILIVGFLILAIANEIGRLQIDVFNQIDSTRIQDGPSLDQDTDGDSRPTPDLTKPGPLSAPPHIYADPNSGNECLLGVPSDPTRPQRVNPHCA
jgi:hypothetical protein